MGCALMNVVRDTLFDQRDDVLAQLRSSYDVQITLVLKEKICG